MKRTPQEKPARSVRASKRRKTSAAPVARKGKPGTRKKTDAAPSALLAEMEQHRDLLQIQNEELGKAHAALEISHQRFSELHEQAPVGYLTLDRQGCIRAINLEAVRLLGVARHTVIGKPFLVFVEQEDRQKFLKHLWELRRARADSQFGAELRLVTSDGTLRHVRMITGRHHDIEGRSSLFLSAISDITELRAASTNAAHLASIVESARDAIVTFTEAGLFRSWNPAAEAIFGYSKDEILGKHVSILAPEDRKGELLQTLKLALSGMPIPPFETIRLRKDGTLVDAEVSLFPILESSRVIALTAIIRDITERKATAERLQKKAELLSLAQEGARMGVFEWDLVTNKAVWTPELEALMGIKLEDMPGNLEPWFAQIHPEDQPRLQQVFQEWMESNRTDVTEHYRFLSNGDERWFELRGRITRDAGGTPLKIIGTNLDITERKKMEAALRESQRLTRATLEAIPAHIALIDESGTIVDINSAWRDFCIENEGHAEAVGCGVNYLTVCAKIHGLEGKEARHFASGIRAVLSGRKQVFTMDYACHSPSVQRWFTGYVTPVAGPGARMAVIAHVNITAVKLAEEKFRGVVESAPDALVITDRVGRIQMVNRQAEKLFGYTRRELVGSNVEMLMPAAFRRAHAARHGQYSDEPTNRPMGGGASFPARRKDGSEFPAEIGLSPLQTAEGMLVCSAIRDITERKKAEDAIRTLNAELEERVVARTAALQKAVESLGQAIEERKRLEKEVLAISEIERRNIGQDLHDDLGQQLAGLWFLSSTLAKSLRPVSSAQAESVANVAAQLNKALALTRSLARGLQPVAPESGGLMAALRELASRSSELFKLHCRLARRPAVLVHDPATATHLYRIAQEAVTNAARHGHASHITILLSSSAGELLLSVNDDGCGMKETTGKHDGMGIRTMRYHAEAMGGSLEFRPRAEGGTTVTCKIPIPSQPEPENH